MLGVSNFETSPSREHFGSTHQWHKFEIWLPVTEGQGLNGLRELWLPLDVSLAGGFVATKTFVLRRTRRSEWPETTCTSSWEAPTTAARSALHAAACGQPCHQAPCHEAWWWPSFVCCCNDGNIWLPRSGHFRKCRRWDWLVGWKGLACLALPKHDSKLVSDSSLQKHDSSGSL